MLLRGDRAYKKELLSIFSNHEINELAPEEGERFDPKYHQAMFEDHIPKLRKENNSSNMNGFTIGERLLRAAQVGVSSGVLKMKKRRKLDTYSFVEFELLEDV